MFVALNANNNEYVTARRGRCKSYVCPECREAVVRRTTGLIRPEFAHKKESQCLGPRDDDQRLEAKVLFYENFTRWSIYDTCSRCEEVTGVNPVLRRKIYTPQMDFTCVAEDGTSCIFDIGILNADGSVFGGICFAPDRNPPYSDAIKRMVHNLIEVVEVQSVILSIDDHSFEAYTVHSEADLCYKCKKLITEENERRAIKEEDKKDEIEADAAAADALVELEEVARPSSKRKTPASETEELVAKRQMLRDSRKS